MALTTAPPQRIQKVSDTIWELATTTKESMRVAARICTTAKFLSEMDEGVFDEVNNVVTLESVGGIRGSGYLPATRTG